MISAPRFTTRMDFRSSTAEASSSGGRSTIRTNCRSAVLPMSILAASASCSGSGIISLIRIWNPVSRRVQAFWFEPIGDWGEGAVKLIEIPTKEEVHDNIAALWQPKQALTAKSEHIFTYRLHWGPDAPKADALARFTRTESAAVAMTASCSSWS